MDKALLRKVAHLHPGQVMQPFDTLMQTGGFDTLFQFAEQLGGLTIYVPGTRTIFAKCLETEAIKEVTGSNYTALAKKYGFAERHIRRIVDQ